MQMIKQGGALLAGSTSLHRSGQRRSRFLVVINKGPGAVPIAREGDAWDLMELYFANNDIAAIESDPARSDADYIVFERDRNMRKFAIIKRILDALPNLFGYEAIMMLDDDVLPVGCTIAEIFTLFMRTGCRIGQPALSEGSYWSHEVVLRHARFRWRRTNFVEVMCPIMTAAAIRDYLPLFDETISAFGLDIYWSSEEWCRYGGVAVLDSTPMRHIRPVRGGTAYQGLSPGNERYAFLRRHKLRNFRHLTLYGEAINDGPLIDRMPMRYRSQLRDVARFYLLSIWQRVHFAIMQVVAFVLNTCAPRRPAQSESEKGRGDDRSM